MFYKDQKNIKDPDLSAPSSRPRRRSRGVNNQEGAALVMALLILFLMMTSAVALSRIIIGEVKMTINTSNSFAAFYAADSGIEKALYYIKYTRRNRGLFSDLSVDWQSTKPFNSLIEDPSYDVGDNGQSFFYVQASTTSPGFITYNVSTSTPAHVDIIDPSGDLSAIDWDLDSIGSHTYQLNWNIENCFPTHASDKLEITTNSFSSSGFIEVDKNIVICNCNNLDNVCDESLTNYPISDNKFYRFSFRPLDSTAESIIFNVYNDSSEIIGIASKAVVIVDGKYKNAISRLKVEIPSLAALSDVFSYVIFSEEEFKKGL